jgi:hypothetical protein
MKPMMSDREARPEVTMADLSDLCKLTAWDPFDRLSGAGAEREARRIVAEHRYFGGTGPSDPQCWYETALSQFGAETRTALSESLSAFLGAEDSAEWLRGRQ